MPMTGWVVHDTVPLGCRSFCDAEGCTFEFETGDYWYHCADGVDLCAPCGERHRARGATDKVKRQFGADELIGCGRHDCSHC